MAKGKHRERAARKRDADEDEQLQTLRRNLRDAKETILALRRQLVDQEGLTAEIARLRIQVEENTSSKYEELEIGFHKLVTLVEEGQRYYANIKKIHENNIIQALVTLGGGFTGYSTLTAILRNAPTIAVTSDYVLSLPEGAAAIIERRKDKNHKPARRRRTLLKLARDFPDEEFVQDLAEPYISPTGEMVVDEVPLRISRRKKEVTDDPAR